MLAAAARAGDRDLRRRMGFIRDRIARLRMLAQMGETLLNAIVAGELVDTGPLRAIAAAMKENR